MIQITIDNIIYTILFYNIIQFSYKMELESEIYKWLVIMDILKPSSKIVINQKTDSYKLDEPST